MTVKRMRTLARSRMYAASAALNRVFNGTSTAPAVWTPNAAMAHSVAFGAQIDTRSPGSMPEAINARAARDAASASSA